MQRTATNYPGLFDVSFNKNLGTVFNSYGTAYGVVKLSDGSVVVGGDFTTFNGNTRNRLIKLSAGGLEDTSFYSSLGTNAFNSDVYAVTRQSTGDIIVGGDFTSIGGTTRNRLSRISPTGTVDATFYSNIGTGGVNGTIYTIAVDQSNQKIVIGGAFTSVGTSTPDGINRLNSDGTVDTSFAANLGTGVSVGFGSSPVKSVGIQSDGKIIVSGSFTTFNGSTRNRMFRLNTDGTEDTSFYTNLGTGFNDSVNTIVVQPDDKILVGGDFDQLNGVTRNRFVRLNSNGTVDTTFYTNMGSAFDLYVQSIGLQSDGKMFVGGSFTSFNGTSTYTGVVLNANGTLYKSFGTYFLYYAGIIGTTVAYVASDDSLYLSGQASPSYFNKFNSLIGSSWTAPAGVTSITSVPVSGTGVCNQNSSTYTVTPGTTYTVAINSVEYQQNNPNTFGGVFSWSNSPNVLITWVE